MNRILNDAGWWISVGGLCAGLCGCATWTAVPGNGPDPVPETPVLSEPPAPPVAPVAPDPEPGVPPGEAGGSEVAPEPSPAPADGLHALQQAWRVATPEEREEFRRWMMDAGE
jgi:hypothetical protein